MIKSSVIGPVAVFLLFILSFIIRFIALKQTPYANGWDGYYYIMQSYTFLERGAMRSLDYSLIYPFYIAVSFIVKDYILAFKIGGAILAATFTSSIFIICKKQSKNKYVPYLIGAFCLFSPGLTYFTAQFPKNLLGIIFLLWLIHFLSEKKLLLTGIFFILAFITHRLSGGLALIIIFVSFFNKKNYRILILLSVIAITAAIILPGVLHTADIERLTDSFTSRIYLPPLKLIQFFGLERSSVFWIAEISLLFIVFLLFIYSNIRKFIKTKSVNKFYIYLLVVLIILILPIYEFTRAGIGFRFFLCFNLLAVMLLSGVNFKVSKVVSIIGVGGLFILSAFSYKSYNPKTLDPPYTDYFITKNKMNEIIPDETELVIAHQGLAQIIITYTKYNATNWQPLHEDKFNNIWRISSNIKYYYFKKYLRTDEIDYLEHLYKDYYLIREDIWQKFCFRAIKSDNESLKEKINSWFNPTRKKPKYLLKGKYQSAVFSSQSALKNNRKTDDLI